MNLLLPIGFALIIGGGIGNLIDRIVHGSVTDFFQIRLGFFRTGIFNIADIAVTNGVFILQFIQQSNNPNIYCQIKSILQ